MINEALATLDDISAWASAGSCGRLSMLRLDKLHPIVSGNKWYKLKYNAAEAKAQGKNTLLTFGGGYSNHLVATAYAARELGLSSIGFVRGHYSGKHFTDTLRACETYGMTLLPMGKSEYATREMAAFAAQFPDAFIIPEGGANELGRRGAADIGPLIPKEATDVCVAIGTGTTLDGLYRALPADVCLHGFYVAKDFERCAPILHRAATDQACSVSIHPVKDQRFGKWSNEAIQFIRSFYETTGIPLDVVYTSKMMMKVAGLLQEQFFGSSSYVVCIHTGGLQGNPRGLFS